MSLAESARQRIREEMERKDINTRDLAQMLGWSQGKVGHLLTGYTAMGLDELERLCFGIGLSPVEAIRDRGLEFCSEMTPTQLRILQRVQQLPKYEDAILTLLDVRHHTVPQGRRAAAHRPPPGKAKPPKKAAADSK
jgi:transcriptional regulator with XRE-family HTH domain